ncbi:estradiol 17-beta-dehydrogenase 2 [Nephila pilipes]|uniref:Estradiol 17-beta-dehydrogenase 2 n=1 Tax=Nephila pilipes TaxID=299642 RepID=A0A8X6PT03_NEPPI|nr:estradiol 17-beta-dehydrogenase 2 [Nephila pilipes]
MLGKYCSVYTLHFLCISLILKILIVTLSCFLTSYLSYIIYFIICIAITDLTFGCTKNRFLNARVDSSNKAVLITGCDTGFGHLLAKRLDSKGFHVFAACLFPSGEGATELKKSCSQRLHVLHVDVTKDDSVKEVVEFVKRNLGASGVVTFPYFTPYTTSKYAAVGFTNALRQELNIWGIKVISIEPEMFKTELLNLQAIHNQVDPSFRNLDDSLKDDLDENFANSFVKLKDCFLFLASPRLNAVVEDLESAVSLVYPDHTYKPRRNAFFLVSYFFVMKYFQESCSSFLPHWFWNILIKSKEKRMIK